MGVLSNLKIQDKTKLYKKAIDVWGYASQLLMAIEEMAELTQAISHLLRGRKNNKSEIIEELADVEVMCEQLRIIIDKNEEIDKIKEGKLMRLAEMLEENNDDQ